PVAALGQALHGKVGRIALVLRCVDEAVEMSAVEADLTEFGPRLLDELQVIGIGVLRPVRDHARKLDAWRLVSLGVRMQWQAGQSEETQQQRNNLAHNRASRRSFGIQDRSYP